MSVLAIDAMSGTARYRYHEAMAKAGPLSAELKKRAITMVLQEMDQGTLVSQACRQVGATMGMNANTLRRLVAEHRKARSQSASDQGYAGDTR